MKVTIVLAELHLISVKARGMDNPSDSMAIFIFDVRNFETTLLAASIALTYFMHGTVGWRFFFLPMVSLTPRSSVCVAHRTPSRDKYSMLNSAVFFPCVAHGSVPILRLG